MPRDPIEHAEHDAFLIAALATRASDAADDTVAEARAMVESCSGCAALHADLLAISAAAATAAVPPRPRDFQLTDADVARLQPRGWRRFMRTVGSPRDSITRPLALGFTTLGLAGLIAASIPGTFMGSAFLGSGAASGDAAVPTLGGQIEQAPSAAAPAAAASAEALYQSDAPTGSNGDTSNAFDGAGEAGNEDTGRTTGASDSDGLAIRDDASGLSALAVIAGSLLIVGLGIFLLRWSARRFGD